MSHVLDRELIARAQQGDRAAAQRVLSSLYESVRKHIDFLTGFGPDAEDLAQEALVEIWRALPSYRAEASLKTWALVDARNDCAGVCFASNAARSMSSWPMMSR